MIKYFKIYKMHIFIEFLSGYYGFQIGTLDNSLGIYLSRSKTYWHNGSYTISLNKRRYVGINLGDERDINQWSMYNWKFIPIGMRCSNKISSEELYLLELANEIDWRVISRFYNLTENQLEEFKNKLDWNTISLNYKLSYKFIIQNKDVIIIDQLNNNSKISKRTKKKILKYILDGRK